MNSRQPTINYSYEEGIDFRLERFSSDGIQSVPGNIPPESLITFGAPEVRHEIIFQTIKTSRGQIEFALIIPPNASSLTVMNLAWGTSARSKNPQEEIQRVFNLLSDQAIVVVHGPGVDSSSPLPKSLSQKIAENGRYGPYGEYIMEALEAGAFLKDFNECNIFGISQGTRHAIAMAIAAPHLNIKELRLVDPLGLQSQSLGHLLRSFLIQEGRHSQQYTLASTDEEAKKFQKEGDRPMAFIHKLFALIKQGGVLDQFRQIQALCRDGLAEDLEQAMLNIRDRLLVLSPQQSGLTDATAMTAFLKILANKVKNSHLNIQQAILPGRTHALSAGNPGVTAALLTESFS